MEKLALKKALFDELKRTNEEIRNSQMDFERKMLQQHKDFIQHIIDICVDRNKF